MAQENSGAGSPTGAVDFDGLFLPGAHVLASPADSAAEREHAALTQALASAPGPSWGGAPTPAETVFPDTGAAASSVTGDSSPRVASGTGASPVFDFSDRPERQSARTPPLVWAALVFAFVAPPVGVVLSILARVLPQRGRGGKTWPVAVATPVSIILTVCLLVGGAIGGIFAKQAADEAAIVADSAAFCTSLNETPGVLGTAGFGWPSENASVTDSIANMTAYQERWATLASIAPAGISGDAESIAESAGLLVSNAEASRSIDRQGNLDQISSVTASTGIPAYVAQYCGN